MKIPYPKAILGVMVVLAVGLVLFFALSSNLADGLERTMEDANVEEGESFYHAPLDYGSGYFSALTAGIVGLILTLLLIVAIGRIVRKRNART